MALNAEHRSKFEAFTDNGDVSKWVFKKSLVKQKPQNKQMYMLVKVSGNSERSMIFYSSIFIPENW